MAHRTRPSPLIIRFWFGEFRLRLYLSRRICVWGVLRVFWLWNLRQIKFKLVIGELHVYDLIPKGFNENSSAYFERESIEEGELRCGRLWRRVNQRDSGRRGCEYTRSNHWERRQRWHFGIIFLSSFLATSKFLPSKPFGECVGHLDCCLVVFCCWWFATREVWDPKAVADLSAEYPSELKVAWLFDSGYTSCIYHMFWKWYYKFRIWQNIAQTWELWTVWKIFPYYFVNFTTAVS